ncbi:Ig-like domain-containing protein [Photobacterium damselae]|uniref:Ig-like domain-containing protein n=1 Tax=Photobacterium damselae TaxID=38293 RepID=UPI001EFD23B9|nr:hypothetical protein [Photobacterium damselae]MCG9778835.1 hypothetical protein [Photobacterium damselae]
MIKKIVLLLMVSGSLIGCGGDNNSDSKPKPKPKPISVTSQDAIKYTQPKQIITVDLSSKVKANNGTALVLTGVKPLSTTAEKCDINSINGLKFTVASSQIGVCRFSYSVAPASEQFTGMSSSISQVVFTEKNSESDSLVPISKTMKPATSIDIDLSDSLPVGFKLDSANMDLLGDTKSGDLGSYSSEGNIIKYAAPSDTSGVIRLYYTATNLSATEVKPGIIYIAIGQDTNSSPYVQQVVKLEPMALIDSEKTLDISKYVSDPDKDAVRLFEVFNNGLGTVSISDDSHITFKPDAIGEQYISYIVTDDKGGYGVGQLSFDVSAYPSIYDENQKLEFTPTYTKADLDRVSGSYSDQYLEDGSTGIPGYTPTFNEDLAQAYCVTKGMILPTKHQLSVLYQDKLGHNSVFYSKFQWPAGRDYMTIDHHSLSLHDGNDHVMTNGYVSCIHLTAPASQYSFDNEYIATKWNASKIVTASTMDHGYRYPLHDYNLTYEVVSTQPAGREADVKLNIKGNIVTPIATAPGVVSAVVKISDPVHVQGDRPETKLLIGIIACPDDVGFIDTQVLGCVPIMSVGKNNELASIALPDSILSSMGLDIDSQPDRFSKTNTVPNYSWIEASQLNDNKVDEFSHSTGKYIQKFCDILNANSIKGRTNWSWNQTINENDYPGKGSWYYDDMKHQAMTFQGDIATEAVHWVMDATGLDSAVVGQGWLIKPGTFFQKNNTLTGIQQLNQRGAKPFGFIEGDQWPPKLDKWKDVKAKEFQNQFIVCYSPN